MRDLLRCMPCRTSSAAALETGQAARGRGCAGSTAAALFPPSCLPGRSQTSPVRTPRSRLACRGAGRVGLAGGPCEARIEALVCRSSRSAWPHGGEWNPGSLACRARVQVGGSSVVSRLPVCPSTSLPVAEGRWSAEGRGVDGFRQPERRPCLDGKTVPKQDEGSRQANRLAAIPFEESCGNSCADPMFRGFRAFGGFLRERRLDPNIGRRKLEFRRPLPAGWPVLRSKAGSRACRDGWMPEKGVKAGDAVSAFGRERRRSGRGRKKGELHCCCVEIAFRNFQGDRKQCQAKAKTTEKGRYGVLHCRFWRIWPGMGGRDVCPAG